MGTPSGLFTLEVRGDGDLTGLFFTEFGKRFPFATCLDRTDRANKSRGNEVKLGRLAHASDTFRSSTSAIEDNLRNASRADITVRFLKIGRKENVAVFNMKSSQTMSFDLEDARSFDQRVGFVSQILRAVASAN
ncbi:MAG TPA: hypothetical protein VEV84_13075 [Pyrinomonadaceae bacterium]|nr:hypothetical protein [Pyrinomonadaceae bacterium]